MLLFNLCLIWKQFPSMSYKHGKSSYLKNPKVMLFLFSEEPNLNLDYFLFSHHLHQ